MFSIITEVCKTYVTVTEMPMLQIKEVEQICMLTLARLKLDQPHRRLNSMLSL